MTIKLGLSEEIIFVENLKFKLQEGSKAMTQKDDSKSIGINIKKVVGIILMSTKIEFIYKLKKT